jgi:hypothetical protein
LSHLYAISQLVITTKTESAVSLRRSLSPLRFVAYRRVMSGNICCGYHNLCSNLIYLVVSEHLAFADNDSRSEQVKVVHGQVFQATSIFHATIQY